MDSQILCQSELSSEEKLQVFGCNASPRDFQRAAKLLGECCSFFELPEPSESDIDMGAKIIAGLPPMRLPRTIEGDPEVHPTWLLTEAWILQGKDPLPIHIAVVSALVNQI